MALVLFDNAFTPVNTDLGWMLAFGRDTTRLGALPTVNGWAFTEPTHPQHMLEWGACLVFFWLHQTLGAAGLIIFKWGMAAVTVGGISAAVAQVTRSTLVRTVVVLLAAHCSWVSFELVRSQLFTFAALSWLVAAMMTPTPTRLALVALLFAPWANVHGGFVAGLVIFSACCGARWLEHTRGWASGRMPLGWAVAGPLAAALATLLNPFGIGMVTEVLGHVSDPSRLMSREWLPLWRVELLAPWERQALVGVGAVLALCAAWLPPRRLMMWALVVLCVATSLSASRHLRMAPLLLAPPAAVALESAIARLTEEARARLDTWSGWGAVCIAVLVGGAFASQLPNALRFIDYPVPNPANAVAVMRENHLTGRVWNDYDWGGLLVWALPDATVACDGRHRLAYSAELIRENINFGLDGRPPLPTLEAAGAEFLLLPISNVALRQVAPVFQPVFCDADACVFSRFPEHWALARSGALKVPTTTLHPSDFF